jgi:tetrahydromethanopterin S-methyltransferase subunit F
MAPDGPADLKSPVTRTRLITGGRFPICISGNAYGVRTLRAYLITAPARKAPLVQGTIQGSIFGTMMGFFYAYQNHHGIMAAAVAGLFAGVVFGTAMAWVGTKQRQKARVAAGPMPTDKYMAAWQAANKGPIPDDPEIREAAGRLVRIRLLASNKASKFNVGVFEFFLLLSVYLAFTATPLWWLSVPFWAGFGLLTYKQTTKIRERADLFGVTT